MVLTVPEGIIIALLGLLAADALTERVGVLDRLETLLAGLGHGKTLRTRQQILSLPQHAAGASDIWILAVSAISIVHANSHFFSSRLREGCNVRFILLDPASPYLRAFDLQYGTPTAEKSIPAALTVLKGLLDENSSGKCEIRLSEVFMPFSMVAVDPQRSSGSMVVEFYAYHKHIGERPHIQLTVQEDPHWFTFYRSQFEAAWSDARQWSTKQSPSPNTAPAADS